MLRNKKSSAEKITFMPKNLTGIKNSKTGKLFFIGSICTFLYWITGNVFDVYRFAFVAAVFELLWLPMLAMLIVLPVLAFIFWVKEKFIIKSFYLFSFLIFITTIMLMIFLK